RYSAEVPEITLEWPEDDTWYTNVISSYCGTITDNSGAGIDGTTFEFSYDGGGWTSFSTDTYSGSHDWYDDNEISTTTQTTGKTLQVKVKDKIGNEGFSSVYTIKVDTTPPTKPLLSTPGDDTWASSTTVTFSWNGSTENTSGILDYRIDVSTAINFGGTVKSSSPAGTDASIKGLSKNRYYWRVRAEDVAGNYGLWSDTYSVKIDTIAPAGTMGISFSNITVSSMGVTASILTDTGSGSVEYYIDCITDDSYDRNYNSDNVYNLPATMTANSTYTYRYRARDAAGKETVWSGNYSTYTLSVPPDWTTVSCNRATGTWVGSADFMFTAAGGFGEGTISKYEYKWDTFTVAVDYPKTWSSGAANVSATFNSDNWYLHVKGYNGAGVVNGTFDFGPYRCSGIPVDVITDLIATTDNTLDGKIGLEWTSVGGIAYGLKYSSLSLAELGNDTTAWWNAAITYSQEWEVGYPGQKEEGYEALGLTPGNSYYMCIRALSIYGSSTSIVNVAGPVIAGDKIPDAPSGLTLSLVDDKVKVNWDANSEPDINKYWVYRDGIIISTVSHSVTKYIDSGIQSENTYTYKLKAIDNTGNISPYSKKKEILAGDAVVYDDIDYIEVGKITDNGIVFGWPQVSNAVKGYAIERTDNPANDWIEVDFVYSAESLNCTVPIEDKPYIYRIVTVSWEGTRSVGSMAIDTSEDFNHFYISEDTDFWVMVPYICAQELYPENNNGKCIKLEFEEEDNSSEEFLISYRIKAVKKNELLTDFVFKNKRMGAKIVFSYKQLQKSKAAVSSKNDTNPMALFWHNGVEWIKLGGINDEAEGEIYMSTRRLGRFGIKRASLADEFTLNRVIPRIFTPNLPLAENPIIDGQRVELNGVHFYFENPKSEEVTIRIFDIVGSQVRMNLKRVSENEMVWDGTDSDGSIVRGGIYIYQIEAEGKVINGTIVIAK
ncbi:hypothetical protein ACFLUV_01845, partial [Elusimicrobiota bacterium]